MGWYEEGMGAGQNDLGGRAAQLVEWKGVILHKQEVGRSANDVDARVWCVPNEPLCGRARWTHWRQYGSDNGSHDRSQPHGPSHRQQEQREGAQPRAVLE